MARPLMTHADLRDRIDLYLNASERAAIAAKARDAGLPLSAFIRRSALRQKVEAIPVASIERWRELARTTANLNQITHAINEGRATGIDPMVVNELAEEVRQLRLELLGSQGAKK